MQLLHGPRRDIQVLAFSPDSRYLAGGDRFCRIWDLHHPEVLPPVLIHGQAIHPRLQLVFLPRVAVGLLFGLALVFDLPHATLRETHDRPTRRRYAHGAADPAHERYKLALRSTPMAARPLLEIVTYPVGESGLGEPTSSRRFVSQGYGSVTVLAFSPDGRYYLTHEGDYLDLRDAATDKIAGRFEHPRSCSHILPFGAIIEAQFSHDGTRVYVPWDKRLLVYEVPHCGPPRAEVPHPGGGKFRSLAAHPAGHILATVETGREVTFRDARTLAVVRRYDFGLAKLRAVAFSPDGTRAAVGTSDGQVLVFDVDG